MPHADRRIVVLGAGGQLGRALVALLGESCIALDRGRADLSEPAALPGILESHAPSAVINAAAYTMVDRAETEVELASTINGEAPGAIARWCAEHEIPVVHFSTDYVFPGDGVKPWSETDAVAPLNAYGASKLAGERAIAEAGGRALIFRTSWVYDATGRNFFTTMMRLMSERTTLSVVADQHGAPTYAPHLAVAAIAALERASAATVFPSGLYHLCNAGETTWHGFVCAIRDEALERGIELAVEEIIAITSEEYPVPATRPANSRLNTNKAQQILGVSLPDWREGLTECMTIYEDHRPAV
jgi:dTDP-4-dehydrorhamnose reductase